MKVLLINPPQTFFPASSNFVMGMPLGIMYIAAVLEKGGYEVEILDCLVSDTRPMKVGPAKRYGMAWEKIGDEIGHRKPDVVGITCPFTTQLENAAKVSEIAKDINEHVLTVVGGPHASVSATQFLEDAKRVDIAVIGEGERTMLDIVKYHEGNMRMSEIRGVAYRDGQGMVVNAEECPFIRDLDGIPFPAYHLVDMGKYLKRAGGEYRWTTRSREIAMITSRGCPYNCIFCSIRLHMGKLWRAHSAEYVTKHLEHVVGRYGVEHIHFEDDNLTLHTRRFEAILDGIIQKGLKFTWDTPNGIRADGLTADLFKKMKRAGCTRLAIGVESGDQTILDNVIGKHLRLEDVIQMARMCKEVDIPLEAFYVIGFPGEKKENMKRTIDFALTLRKTYGVEMCLMFATPLYGTKLHEICSKEGYLTQELTPRALSEGTGVEGTSLIRTEDFGPEDTKALALEAVAAQTRLSLSGYGKNPMATLRRAIRNPKAALRLIRSAFRIQK